MTQPAQTPSRLKKWTERLTLASTIVAILGLTVSGVLGTAWQAVWNYFDPPPPQQTRLIAYDPWLASDAEMQAVRARRDDLARCQSFGMRPWGGTRRCFLRGGVWDDCYPEPEWIRGYWNSKVVACIDEPDKPPFFVRVAHFDKEDRFSQARGIDYTPKSAWIVQLQNARDRCAVYNGTRLTIAGKDTLMYCNKKGWVLGISKDGPLWFAEYAQPGQTVVRKLPIEIVWF